MRRRNLVEKRAKTREAFWEREGQDRDVVAGIKTCMSISRVQKTSNKEGLEEKRKQTNPQANPHKSVFDYPCLNSHV